MARTFSALRPNDLIFQYVGNNWLCGNKPPSFDLLAWNEDSTRMPAKMHSEYLRSCYLRNEFARGEFEIDSIRLDPGLVDIDTYVLAAVDDHIVPWTSGYKTTQLLGWQEQICAQFVRSHRRYCQSSKSEGQALGERQSARRSA
jgi:polyhydroxyalkanoate synthase subunit PhaC